MCDFTSQDFHFVDERIRGETRALYDTLILSVFPLMVVMAGISDFFTLKIPNWLNAVIAVSVVPFVILAGMPLEIFAWHIIAGLVTFVVGFILFSINIIGGGDAKMLAACAVWVGWDVLMEFAVVTVFAGAVLVIAIKVWVFFANRKDIKGMDWAKNFLSKKPQLPYGIAIAAGGVIVFPATWWIQQIL